MKTKVELKKEHVLKTALKRIEELPASKLKLADLQLLMLHKIDEQLREMNSKGHSCDGCCSKK